jgi:hypothetical protein
MTWLIAVGVIALVIVAVNVVMRAQARALEERVRRERPGWSVHRAHVTPALGSALEADGVWRPELRNLGASDLVLAAGADGVELWCPPGKEPVLRRAWRDVSAVTTGGTTWEFTDVPAVVLHSRHGAMVPVVLAAGGKRHAWTDQAATDAVVAELRALRDADADRRPDA